MYSVLSRIKNMEISSVVNIKKIVERTNYDEAEND